MTADVTVVVLAFGDEPLLGRCVGALLRSAEVRVEVVVVDNGCTSGAVSELPDDPRVVVLDPGRNLGFAAGCNAGSARASGRFLALVNSDAVVDEHALAALVRAVSEDGVGLATSSLRLLSDPEAVNSVGNPVHFTGLSWAGGLGEPAVAHAAAADVASASGAAMLLRTSSWRELGGFYEPLWAYQEDAELSLRLWRRGQRVRYVPDAVVLHDYAPSRNPRKNELLERNRLVVLLTVFSGRALFVLSPVLVLAELAVLAVSARQRWLAQKLGGYRWLLANRQELAARRREVQRQGAQRHLTPVLTGDLPGDAALGTTVPAAVRVASRAYWSFARRLLS